MFDGDGKDFYREMVTIVKRRLAALPESSPLRAAIPTSFLEEITRRIEQPEPAGLENGPWAPAFSGLSHIPEAAVVELDNDLALVLRHVKSNKAQDVTQFIRTTASGRVAEWYGGLFDVWARATVLKAGCEVEFDASLPNGRDSDMRAKIRGRDVRLENTVIGESDDDRKDFESFLEEKKKDPKVIWQRPGKLDPPGPRPPSLYYNSFRLYAKVYDKIAKNLDPDKSQCAADEPNIVLVSFSGPFVHPDMPGWGWAIDELFADHPSVAGRIARAPHLTDISLDAWIMFTAEQYNASMDDYHRIIAAPRRLGGILVFKNCTLAAARTNYNALDECSITHAEMAELERIFTARCGYAI